MTVLLFLVIVLSLQPQFFSANGLAGRSQIRNLFACPEIPVLEWLASTTEFISLLRPETTG
jgi:hypothetical protein